MPPAIDPHREQIRSKRGLSPHRNRIKFRPGIARIGRADLPRDVSVQIVEHESDISTDVPVQGCRIDCLAPTGDARCRP